MSEIRPPSVPEPILPFWSDHSRSQGYADSPVGTHSSKSSLYDSPTRSEARHSASVRSSHRVCYPHPGSGFRHTPSASEADEPESPHTPESHSVPTFRQLSLKSNGDHTTPLSKPILVLLVVVPHQIYLHSLFRLPELYFSRFRRIFETGKFELQDLRQFAQSIGRDDELLPRYGQLQDGWERLLDDLVKEWNTLNVVSALLVPAILTLFQIDGAARDPIARFFAFCTLVFSLFSLLYGCSFISIFSFMRHGSMIAEVALQQSHGQPTLWNFWVALAMPAIWLVWAIISFMVCIMTFMWRSRADTPPDLVLLISPSTELLFRLLICILLGTGAFIAIAIIITFQGRFSKRADRAWKNRLANMFDTQKGGGTGRAASWQGETERPGVYVPRSRSRSRPPSRPPQRPPTFYVTQIEPPPWRHDPILIVPPRPSFQQSYDRFPLPRVPSTSAYPAPSSDQLGDVDSDPLAIIDPELRYSPDSSYRISSPDLHILREPRPPERRLEHPAPRVLVSHDFRISRPPSIGPDPSIYSERRVSLRAPRPPRRPSIQPPYSGQSPLFGFPAPPPDQLEDIEDDSQASIEPRQWYPPDSGPGIWLSGLSPDLQRGELWRLLTINPWVTFGSQTPAEPETNTNTPYADEDVETTLEAGTSPRGPKSMRLLLGTSDTNLDSPVLVGVELPSQSTLLPPSTSSVPWVHPMGSLVPSVIPTLRGQLHLGRQDHASQDTTTNHRTRSRASTEPSQPFSTLHPPQSAESSERRSSVPDLRYWRPEADGNTTNIV